MFIKKQDDILLSDDENDAQQEEDPTTGENVLMIDDESDDVSPKDFNDHLADIKNKPPIGNKKYGEEEKPLPSQM
jgi:hypothetical protein